MASADGERLPVQRRGSYSAAGETMSVVAAVVWVCAVVGMPPPALRVGDAAPGFNLPGADGFHSLSGQNGRMGTVVVFWRNGCPVCRAELGTLRKIAAEWVGKGFAFVAINSADAGRERGESFEDMQRLFHGEYLPFPYVKDLTQETALTYRVAMTPAVFVVDAKGAIGYVGGLAGLPAALEAIAAGRAAPANAPPMKGTPLRLSEGLAPRDADHALAAGERIPAFELVGVDGDLHRYAAPLKRKATAFVFACDSCPEAIEYQDRLIALAKRYKPDTREAAAEIVLINSNDARQVPEDSFDAMRTAARAKAYPFVYLYDEGQHVAKAFGATRTPQVFVVDRDGVGRYAGAIDDSVDALKVTRRYLQDALDAVVAGRTPATARTEPVGCTIKWKKDARP